MAWTPTAAVSIAWILILGAVAATGATGGIAVAANHGPDEPGAYAVEQGDRCIEVEPLGNGSQNVSAFYDYRGTDEGSYSSHGTRDIQRSQVSQIFVYHGSEGVSLVFLHDELHDDEGGGAVSVDVAGLPTSGEWAVEDDDYPGRDDNFDHDGTESEIDWMWADGRTDGAAFRGLGALDGEITIDPAFSEESYAHSINWSYSEDDLTFAARRGTGDLETLDQNETVAISQGGCTATPPDAQLDVDPAEAGIGETVTFDASDSFDETGIEEYRWDLTGDGEIDEAGGEPVVEQTYATPRDVEARVTVLDRDGQTANATVTVRIRDDTAPNARASTNQTIVEPGEVIAFDGTNSSDDDEVEAYEWAFGDGTNATGPTVEHTYDEEGRFNATLTVRDRAGNGDSTTVNVTVREVSEPPDASLVAPESVAVGESVTFDAGNSSDDGGIEEYRWDLTGDGEIDRVTGTNVTTWTYDQPGTVTVAVTVADATNQTSTANATVRVDPVDPPTARIDANRTTVGPGDPIAFDGTNSSDDDGTIEAYDWRYGDGGAGSGPVTTHGYAENGTYDVELTVGDDGGNDDTATVTVTVEGNDQDGNDGNDESGEGNENGNDGENSGNAGGSSGGSSGGASGGSSAGGSSSGGSTAGSSSSGSGSSGGGSSGGGSATDPTVETAANDDGSVQIEIEGARAGEPVTASVGAVGDETVGVNETAGEDAADDRNGSVALRAVEVVPDDDGAVDVVVRWSEGAFAGSPPVDDVLGTVRVTNRSNVASVGYEFVLDADVLGEEGDETAALVAAHRQGRTWTTRTADVESGGSSVAASVPPGDAGRVVLGVARSDVRTEDVRVEGRPVAGDEVTVRATVRNDGHRAANQTVTLVVDDRPRAATTVRLQPGERETVSLSVTLVEPGSRELSVRGASRPVRVAPREPDVAIRSVTTSAPIRAGEELAVTATFGNAGGSNGTATATFSAFGERINGTDVTVPAGETRTVTFRQRIDAPGNYTIGVNGRERVVTVRGARTTTDVGPTPAGDGPNEEGIAAIGTVSLVVVAVVASRFL